MSVPYIWKGATGLMVREEVITTPIGGVARTEEWQGTPSFCDSLMQNAQSAGVRAQITREKLPWRVVLTYQDSDGVLGEAPRVEWNHNTELIDKEWFDLDGIQAEAVTYPDGAAAYRGTIKRFVDEGKPYTGPAQTVAFSNEFPIGLYPFAHKIWFELARGSSGFQDALQVVTRFRSASWLYPFQRQILAPTFVYSPAQLGIPSDIVSGIALPPVRTQTIVGWRLRSQTFSMTGERRTETIEFILAAWSTLGYLASSGNYS